MLPKIDPSTTKAWKDLSLHYKNEVATLKLKSLFSNDKERFQKLSITYGDFLFDFSKNLVTEKTLQLLLQLAEETKLKDAIAAMFGGSAINETEKRQVLHIALRNFSSQPV